MQHVKFFISNIFRNYIYDFIMENSCLAKLFGYSTQKDQNKKVFKYIDWDELYRKKDETTIEDPYQTNSSEIFNLIKEHSIEEVESMNISNIQTFKLQNGETAFKYPSIPLKYSSLPLNELPDEKVYYLKTLFNNYKLIDLLKEEPEEITYPHISLDNDNNITSMKDKIIKVPYDRKEEYRYPLDSEIESKFEKLNEHYEAYGSRRHRLFKVGISVKLFRVLSAYVNKCNKQYPPKYPNRNIYYWCSDLDRYYPYTHPYYPALSYHMGHFLQYSIYDKEKSIFYLYMPFETAEDCMRILYNLSWVSYDILFIEMKMIMISLNVIFFLNTLN